MINIGLFSLFHLSLIALIVYVARFKLVNYGEGFKALVKVFALLIIVYFVLIHFRVGTPIALLYGPIHLSLYRIGVHKSPKKYLVPQLLPFLFMLLWYSVLHYAVQSNSSWSEVLFIYYPVYFVCTIISSVSYSVYIWMVKWKTIPDPRQRMLILQLAGIAFVIAIFISIGFLTLGGKLDKMNIGFDAFYIVRGLLLLCAFFLVSYLAIDRNQSRVNEADDLTKSKKLESTKYNTFNIDKKVFDGYTLILEQVINDKRLYLNSGLSLDDLSVETGIPKHHLSQLFNIHLGKSFYQYIAERRIKEAIFRIQEDDNITLESLAYECGFNSRTSFNRYFKDITGTTPSDYRDKNELIK